MDFLDPKKQRQHAFLLFTGYIFIGIAVLISTLVLVYQANGFGVNGKGELVQNGLVFVSSRPDPANIYLNGKLESAQTNNRLSLATGKYDMRLTRDGYRDWTRTITVLGGDVQNYDYPFLFPKSLQSNSVLPDFSESLGLVSQSRDRRWLMVQSQDSVTSFTVYDLNEDETDQLVGEPVVLPEGIITPADGEESWEEVQWANDNVHVLLKHTYGSGSEYILVSRTKPEESVNLNQTLATSPAKLTLVDNRFDMYHVLIDGTLNTATLDNPALQKVVGNVVAYKSYGTDTVLYVTDLSGVADKVNIAMAVKNRDYTLRQINKSETYNLDLANYRDNQYVVVGGSSEEAVYVYKNPVKQLRQPSVLTAQATRALRVDGATHVSFSPSTRFILAQNGNNFAVYDSYLNRPYVYQTEQTLDAGQQHALWMDSNHLTFTSAGKQIVLDYDGRNIQELMAALPNRPVYFSQDYRFAYSLVAGDPGVIQLQRTGLETPEDL